MNPNLFWQGVKGLTTQDQGKFSILVNSLQKPIIARIATLALPPLPRKSIAHELDFNHDPKRPKSAAE